MLIRDNRITSNQLIVQALPTPITPFQIGISLYSLL